MVGKDSKMLAEQERAVNGWKVEERAVNGWKELERAVNDLKVVERGGKGRKGRKVEKRGGTQKQPIQ